MGSNIFLFTPIIASSTSQEIYTPLQRLCSKQGGLWKGFKQGWWEVIWSDVLSAQSVLNKITKEIILQ